MRGIGRQVALLDALGDGPEGGLSVTDVADAVGMPKSTTHRTLEGMRGYGMVVQEPDSRKWRLGPRVAFWAGRYLEGTAILAPLRRVVSDLGQGTRFVAYLVVLDDGEPVCVAVERPEGRAQFLVHLGRRLPVLSAAAAKALLAFQPEDVLRPVVERAIREDPVTRLGAVTAESYLKELAEVRSQGYALCMEELEAGISAAGAPIFNARGLPAASIAIVATSATLFDGWEATLGALLFAAEEGSRAIGGRTDRAARGRNT